MSRIAIFAVISTIVFCWENTASAQIPPPPVISEPSGQTFDAGPMTFHGINWPANDSVQVEIWKLDQMGQPYFYKKKTYTTSSQGTFDTDPEFFQVGRCIVKATKAGLPPNPTFTRDWWVVYPQ